MQAHDIHPEDIKAEIRKAGATLASLGRSHGLSRQQMSLALHARVSAKAEKVIADFLQKQPRQIWPSRYTKTGKRLSLTPAQSDAA
ncbi:helix-turn-helix domain-containing protein [uncultured Sphingobium sp.]|uniref:helix-turn-helix domain-containing protein n=1 Tax=uncultured Sphingobium sp. TaxID=316087 RepID=UPI00338D543C